MRSNCLFYAIALYWRRRGHRGYFTFRKSDHGWFPHFLYFEKHHIVSYKPHNPTKQKCPPAFFEGGVCWGDKKVNHDTP